MGFNAKLFEVVLYPESFAIDQLKVILDGLSGLRHYAYCVHDQDEGKKEHCHVMLRMNNGNNSDYVAKWFNVSSSQVEKCKGKWADMLAYLTHANATDKVQYDPEKVVSNFDWKVEADKAGGGSKRLAEIQDGILTGQIRKFNLSDHVNISEHTRFKRQINDAFEYRINKIKTGERDMKTYYIWGESGSGKTTFAKTKAIELGYSYYISSGSNDILDGYEGQDCLILDDLRPSCLGLSDLLKMLDPNTASSVKSRYYNKILECKLVIITTTMPMETFFQNVFKEEKEPLKQLERRCPFRIHMMKNRILVEIYQNKSSRYEPVFDGPNFVLLNKNIADYTEAEKTQAVHDLFGSLSESIEDLKKYMPFVGEKEKLPPAAEKIIKMFPGSTLQGDLFPENEKASK